MHTHTLRNTHPRERRANPCITNYKQQLRIGRSRTAIFQPGIIICEDYTDIHSKETNNGHKPIHSPHEKGWGSSGV